MTVQRRTVLRGMLGASALVAWDSRFSQKFYGNLGKGEWQGTFGRNVVVDALVG